MEVATVGHVEWCEFARVERVPAAGDIAHVLESWSEAAGGGAVTGVQLARLAGAGRLFTALGDDEAGHRALAGLEALGLRVEVAWRDEPQRRGFVFVDDAGERTITVIGDRLGPEAGDPLPWSALDSADAVYFTAGDAGAVRESRRAGTLVATARALGSLRDAGVRLDALVASASDTGERYERGGLDPEPALVVRTAGADGGEWEAQDGGRGRFPATELLGPVADAYGCGDSFAGGLTFGLGAGMELSRALEIGARCGAACLTGRGPYAAQLGAADL